MGFRLVKNLMTLNKLERSLNTHAQPKGGSLESQRSAYGSLTNLLVSLRTELKQRDRPMHVSYCETRLSALAELLGG